MSVDLKLQITQNLICWCWRKILKPNADQYRSKTRNSFFIDRIGIGKCNLDWYWSAWGIDRERHEKNNTSMMIRSENENTCTSRMTYQPMPSLTLWPWPFFLVVQSRWKWFCQHYGDLDHWSLNSSGTLTFKSNSPSAFLADKTCSQIKFFLLILTSICAGNLRWFSARRQK